MSAVASEGGIAGFAAVLGIAIADWEGGVPHLVLPVRADFINRNGAVHGGVIMTLLDTVCSMSGCRYEGGVITGRVVLVSMTANFIAPVVSGTMHARARLRGGGRKLVMAEGEVTDNEGRLIATASAIVRRIQEQAE